MKRILITSTDLMMIQFLLPHVRNLNEKGYTIELACSEVGDRLNEVRDKVGTYVKAIHKVRLRRNPLSIRTSRAMVICNILWTMVIMT